MQNKLIEEIKNTVPREGKIAAWWLGQMGYVFKSKSTTIMIDGFLTPRADRLIAPAFSANTAVIFDAVIGSHNHDDHIDQPAWKTIHEINPNTVFIAPKPHRDNIFNGTGIDIQGIDEGEGLCIGDFEISAIAAAHEFIEYDLSGHSKHLSYIISTPAGKRIFHAGDTLVYEGQRAKLRSFGLFDAMILPINGRDAERYLRNCIGNMTFQEAVDLAGELCPAMAIPGHYDMFNGNTANPEDFRAYINAKYPSVTCCIPERYRMFEI